MDLVKFLEEKHNTMSDYCLIDNLRDLTNILSTNDSEIDQGNLSMRYKSGDISEDLVGSMMGQTFDLDDITVTEINSFQYGEEFIAAMEALNEETCFVIQANSGYIEQIDTRNGKERKFKINVNDICLTDDVFVTNVENNSIVRLFPSGSVSTVFSTAPLEPLGICQSSEGGLLVTMVDTQSEQYQPDSSGRRPVQIYIMGKRLRRTCQSFSLQ